MISRKLQKKRIKICNDCDSKSEGTYGAICNYCRCVINAKTLFKQQKSKPRAEVPSTTKNKANPDEKKQNKKEPTPAVGRPP